MLCQCAVAWDVSACRFAASSSVVRASVPSLSAASRIPPTLWRPTRTVQSLSAWTQWWDAATATPAAISTLLCTSKPISRPHSLGLARYAKLSVLLLSLSISLFYSHSVIQESVLPRSTVTDCHWTVNRWTYGLLITESRSRSSFLSLTLYLTFTYFKLNAVRANCVLLFSFGVLFSILFGSLINVQIIFDSVQCLF